MDRDRREFIKRAAAGTVIVGMGGALYRILSDDLTRAAEAQRRDDGRPRLPPGQRVIEALRPMGGEPGSPDRDKWSIKVHGEVERPFSLNFKDLQGLPQTSLALDVHCVTAWSVLGAIWQGVQIKTLAERCGVKKEARYVIFEGAHGYTSNVPLREAMHENNLIAHSLQGRPLAEANGAPVRAVVPNLYFWKSTKWLTGIRFVARDQPGYWETRGYHNHADPWLEERYS